MLEKIISLDEYKNDEYSDVLEDGSVLKEIIIHRHKKVSLIYEKE